MKKMNFFCLVILFSIIISKNVNAKSDNTSLENAKPMQYGYMEKVTVLAKYKKNVIVEPSGQPKEGIRLRSGGCIYVNTSGGPTVSLSVILPGKVLDISVNAGYISNNSIGGYCVKVPNKYNFFKVKNSKLYNIEKHKVDQYQTGTYIGTYYSYKKTFLSDDLYLVKVK